MENCYLNENKSELITNKLGGKLTGSQETGSVAVGK